MKRILVIGTYDTKSDELNYMERCIANQGGKPVSMDVSVLGDPSRPTQYSKHEVAAAADTTIQAVIDSGDENSAMQLMSKGAAELTRRLYADNLFDGMIALGGTMGTDLALDCASALPMGVPKYIVSTVSFSPLIPTERLASDIQMILWAGGLYGLNSVCKSSLSQAAGAVLGAAKAVEPPQGDRPLVGMMSLGNSCLSYMVNLKPALEDRGFEVAVFHATGMGGRAFESLAAEGAFAAVMDFALPELGNLLNGSPINAGSDRMTNAGAAGIPQLVAPGCLDLIDFQTWLPLPEKYIDRPYHAHNRLICSVALSAEERRQSAREIASRLSSSQAPVEFIMPMLGIEEWDREGEDAHDPEGLQNFIEELREVINPPLKYTEIDAHINDQAFTDYVLKVFDEWVANGTIKS
ncbi:MAG: hypothetical protein ACI8P9_003478 [Parasphingorhabdus sp.]|jgi:uncharacterized protein (UPF0261 family)